nr:hypothetical protein [Tanacetum cinerariifolium]
MSSASFAVTYTSVYTDSEPGRTPLAPQDENEHEPMFIQPHDPDFMPELIYPQYIPLEDEYILPAKEEPLPHIDSPTAESPEYVDESNQEEDPEEYEDDKIEDGPVNYHMDGEDNGDDDDGDSSGDDDDDEDEDEEDEKEDDEHLTPVDSAVVIPTNELASPPEGTCPVIPLPSTDTSTIRARITVRRQAAISFPPEPEVERHLAMPTPSPSPLASISPPSAGERLARCMAPAALPSPPLPPPLHIPPPVDRRYDIPKTEMPPRKRLCLSTLGSKFEVEKSSTARPTEGQGIDFGDTWVDPTEAVPKIAPMTVGEVNTRVTKLVELHEHDTQDLYALLEDAQDSRTRISQRVNVDSQRVDILIEDMIAQQETIQIVEDEAYAAREAWAHASGTDGKDSLSDGRHETRDGQHTGQVISTARIMAPMTRQGPSTLPNNTNPNNMTQESVQAMIDQALLRNSTNGDGSHRTKGVVGLTRWIEKMESFFQISGCAVENQIKFATCTLLDAALTWWNSQIRSLVPDAYSMTWEVLKKKMTNKYCPRGKIKKLEIELWNLSGLPDNIYENVKASKPKTLDETIELANELMDQKLRGKFGDPGLSTVESDESGRKSGGKGLQVSGGKTRSMSSGSNVGKNRDKDLALVVDL